MIKKFIGRKAHTRSKDNIWAVDLVEVGWLSSFNCRVKYLLSVIDVFIKYARLNFSKMKKLK